MALASRSTMRGVSLLRSRSCLSAVTISRSFGTSDGRPFPAIFADTKVICQGFTGGQVRADAPARSCRARPESSRRVRMWEGGAQSAAREQEGATARSWRDGCRACPALPDDPTTWR